MYGDGDPYSCNFEYEGKKARGMGTDSLIWALKDAIEASQAGINEGKYYDQASVYRRELENRGISFEEQDVKLNEISSLHHSF